MAQLAAWQNFYIIVGSSAGALIGLTFIAITLVAAMRDPGLERGVAAFQTPIVVDFCTVLFMSALLSAPWSGLTAPAVVLALCALLSLGYDVIVVRRLRSFERYTLILEDWVWYVAFPTIAYLALGVAAVLLPRSPVQALFIIAGVMLLLLFKGIRNAWDIVIYSAIVRLGQLAAESNDDKNQAES